MSILTLDDAKAHMRVTIADDDALIQAKIDAAEDWIMGYLGGVSLGPPQLTEATRQLVAFLYDNREAAVVGNTITVTAMTPGFYDLLAPFRCYVF